MSVQGFTLLELMVAMAVVAMVAVIAAPRAFLLYEGVRYRETVRELATTATSARYRAITGGVALDLKVDPEKGRYGVVEVDGVLNDDNTRLLDSRLSVQVVVAEELSAPTIVGVIRFYPDGSSSGGSITLWRESGQGMRVRVDWLLGRVTRELPL